MKRFFAIILSLITFITFKSFALPGKLASFKIENLGVFTEINREGELSTLVLAQSAINYHLPTIYSSAVIMLTGNADLLKRGNDSESTELTVRTQKVLVGREYYFLDGLGTFTLASQVRGNFADSAILVLVEPQPLLAGVQHMTLEIPRMGLFHFRKTGLKGALFQKDVPLVANSRAR